MTDVLILGVDRRGVGATGLPLLRSGAVSPVPRVSRDGDLPLSFSQERLWFLQQLDPGSATYHLTCELRISGPLSVNALQLALDELIRRHESLRTTFVPI